MSPTITRFKTKPAAPTPAASTAPAQFVFDALPDSAWLRESQLVRSPKNPDSAIAPLPFSAPTLWRMVKAGRFPAPHKLSTRVTAWKVAQVREWMTTQAEVQRGINPVAISTRTDARRPARPRKEAA